jgi:hypothetical protein
MILASGLLAGKLANLVPFLLEVSNSPNCSQDAEVRVERVWSVVILEEGDGSCQLKKKELSGHKAGKLLTALSLSPYTAAPCSLTPLGFDL